MLSLLIISLIAGTSYCEKPSEYSDCVTEQNIVDECSSHLDYLQKLDPPEVTSMKRVSDLEDPLALLKEVHLNHICNETMHLKMYFDCVFSNLTTCLQAANSSQMNGLPDPGTISKGIVDMCNSRDDLNKTCILEKEPNVVQCETDMKNKKGGTQDECAQSEVLITCTEELIPCAGQEIVKDYVVSARPHHCQDTSAAARVLATLSLLLVSLMLSLGLTKL